MDTKIQFTDYADRQVKINDNTDKILIQEQNLIEGNFLIFSDVKPLEMQLTDLNNTTNMILLKQEGII